MDPAAVHVMYEATSPPLGLRLISGSISPGLYFEGTLPDGTYRVEGSDVMTDGAVVTGTFTFSRSRDVPFIDIAEPKAGPYTSTIDASFNLVAVLPHPDPAMGPGCRLETGEQHVSLAVSGPVKECSAGLGGH